MPDDYYVSQYSGEEIDERLTAAHNAVRYDAAQSLTDAQKAQARNNISAMQGIESTEHPGCYYVLNGSTVEWINPPLELGVEYRTTERYFGKPVYVKLVDFGALPNNTSKGVAIDFNIDSIISFEIIAYSPEILKGACLTGDSGITGVSAVPSNNSLWIRTDQDLSATAVYCFCKYTKTTN